jgi:hypothetical protein
MEKRAAAIVLGLAVGSALVGCPALSAIEVGDGNAGGQKDGSPSETSGNTDAKSEGGCSVDPRSDPKNCGHCGHDCGDGACAGGVCQPYPIVTDVSYPYGVAAQGGNVYFTTRYLTVYLWCGVGACLGSLKQLASTQAGPRGITTDTTNVYWANSGFPGRTDAAAIGSIATCGLAGCAGGATTVYAPAEEGPVDLAVDSSAVYWTDTTSGKVRRCAVGGCGGSPTTLATDSTTLSGVAVDATSIYWAEAKLGNIIQCPLSGCPTFTPFASGQTDPAEIDTANGDVYWSANGAIMSCPATGCGGSPRVFAKNQPSSFAIAHDETTLYWTQVAESGKVLSCPLSGCTEPTVLAEMQNMPTSVAVDSTSVYWANSGGATIMRVMK